MRWPSPPLPPVTSATAPLSSMVVLLLAPVCSSCHACPLRPTLCGGTMRAGKPNSGPLGSIGTWNSARGGLKFAFVENPEDEGEQLLWRGRLPAHALGHEARQ